MSDPITSGIGQEARALDWFIRNSDRRNPTAFINTNPAYFADECAAAITAGTLATTPPKQGEDAVREAADAVIAEMIEVATAEDGSSEADQWPSDCRDTIDRWQGKLQPALGHHEGFPSRATLSANQSGADAGEVIDPADLPIPAYADLLKEMQHVMQSHQFWRKVVGTPAENDLPVRAANVAMRHLVDMTMPASARAAIEDSQ